jgi:hypothetical protein
VAFETIMPPALLLVAVGTQVARVATTPGNATNGKLLQLLGVLMLMAGLNEVVRPDVVHPERFLRILTFEGISPQECDYMTRLTKEQIGRVYHRLRFPQGQIEVVGENFRLNFDSEWLFLLLLYRLCHGSDYEGMISTFGKEATQLCRGFNYALDWVYRNWAFPKMHESIPEIQGRIQDYCRAISVKVESLAHETNIAANQLVGQGEHVPPWTLLQVDMAEAPPVFGMLDGTQREVQRPLSGPAEAGVLAQRHPFYWEVQNAFFSGHQGYCSQKYITFNGPDGHIAYCSQAYSGRNNDPDVVRRIGLHAKLVAAQANLPLPLKCLYGDSAFAREVCIEKGFPTPRTPNQSMLNLCFNKVRTSVEHIYGIVLSNFRLNMVWWKKSVRSYQHQIIWPVSCFLCNILNCLNHNQVSEYFNMSPMTLEEYLPAPNDNDN